jgi:DNA-binding MarR family transcriptional regulator
MMSVVPGDHVSEVLEQWQREAPKLDPSPMGIVGRISRLAQLLQIELDHVFADHGLTGGEFDVLAALRRSGKPYRLSPTRLSTSLMVTGGGMTKRLAALERRALIAREADPDDGRSSLVSLTPAGKRLVETALTDHLANEERLLAGISVRARGDLARLLETLAISLGDTRTSRRRR